MRIRKETTLRSGSREDQQQTVIEAIRELEQQHENGTISDHAYFEKKRSLIRML